MGQRENGFAASKDGKVFWISRWICAVHHDAARQTL